MRSPGSYCQLLFFPMQAAAGMSKIFPFLTRTRRGLIPARPPTSIKRESKNSGCFQSFLSYPFLQQPHHHTVHNEAPDGAPIDVRNLRGGYEKEKGSYGLLLISPPPATHNPSQPKLMRIQRTTSPRVSTRTVKGLHNFLTCILTLFPLASSPISLFLN